MRLSLLPSQIFIMCISSFLSFKGELSKQTPNNSLIHFLPITSLLLQLAAIVGFQLLAFHMTLNQDWFAPYDNNDPYYTNATYSNETWAAIGRSPGEYYNQTGIEGSIVSNINVIPIMQHTISCE